MSHSNRFEPLAETNRDLEVDKFQDNVTDPEYYPDFKVLLHDKLTKEGLNFLVNTEYRQVIAPPPLPPAPQPTAGQTDAEFSVLIKDYMNIVSNITTLQSKKLDEESKSAKGLNILWN